MNRKFLILLFVLTCVAGRAWAQMTDDQIIDYVQRGVTSGKNQQQLARELLVRGVSQSQLLQLKAKYDAGELNASGSKSGSKSGQGQSLLSATVADGVTGDRHNSNTELIAQGAANIVVPFFGGIPVTGAIARTMTNINNGGRTPVAGIVHAVVLLLILLFLSPLTRHIPMACLAGVLVIVSYNMSEWRTIRGMMKNPKADLAVLFTTLLLTVIFDLTIAIAAGLLMAVVMFMRRIMESTNISVIHDQIDMTADAESNHRDDKVQVAKGIEVYEIDGPFFFGIASKFDDIMHTMGEKAQVRIIRMRKVPFIDSTGLHNLTNLIEASRKEGIEVILSGVNPSVRETLLKAGLDRIVGKENICANIHLAVERAEWLVNAQTK